MNNQDKCNYFNKGASMRDIEEIKKSPRLNIQQQGQYAMGGTVIHPLIKNRMVFIASWNDGWEHVSISYKHKNPTWDEMCMIKDVFWNDDETVVQFHPPKDQYVNVHPHCLHLWKEIGKDYMMPNPNTV